MSSNFQNHSSPCAFAETLVSYLYGESETNEKIKFEAHLSQCASCSDELASFGLVRSAVLNWRTESFSNLETPPITIPELETEKIRVSGTATETRSWLGDLRNIFSFNPAIAMALTILVIGVGFAFYIFNFNGTDEFAERGVDKNLAQAIVSPTPAPENKLQEESKTAVSSEKSAPVVEIKTPTPKTVKQNVSNKSVVRVSTVESKDDAVSAPRVVKESNGGTKKAVTVKKPAVPNLNDAQDDDADETLRLADLFAELDTKE